MLVTLPTPEAVTTAIQQGFTFLALGVDALLLAGRCQEIVSAAHTASGRNE
jgi:hypothetical protein